MAAKRSENPNGLNDAVGGISGGEAMGGDGDGAAPSIPPPAQPEGKMSKPAPGILARLDLDVMRMVMMVKGSVAPTIAIAIYQSTAVANYFTTLGYLIGIISILALPILPRGKFVVTMMLNIVFTCVGAAMSLLILWTSLQARLQTESSRSVGRAVPYNSSQSAVSALWLFCNIWIVNVMRAKNPSLNVPVIIYSIMISIASTYSPLMTSSAEAESLVKRLFVSMLAAFAIAIATSLLVFPVTSRKVTYAQMTGAIMLLRGAVKQEKVYLQNLEREDMFAVPADVGAGGDYKGNKAKGAKTKPVLTPAFLTQAEGLKATIAKIRELSGKIQADLNFAKRDISWSKLDPADLKQISVHIRSCTVPIVGISTVIDVFQRITQKQGWMTDSHTPPEVVAEKNEEKRVWSEVMRQLHEPFEMLSEAVDEGLLHAGLRLEMLPAPKPQPTSGQGPKAVGAPADVEARGDLVKPGDAGFALALEKKLQVFEQVKGLVLRVWAKERGLVADETWDVDVTYRAVPPVQSRHDSNHERDQSQLYLLLYLEKLMQQSGAAVQRFVAFADEKVESGSMRRKQLFIPKARMLKKMAMSIFDGPQSVQDHDVDVLDNVVYMGDGFAAKRRDPEHLPPTNVWQRFGNGVRAISKFLSSQESAFGVRCALATMTVGIIGFLENSQNFFQKQRLVWAMIIVGISMMETSGQSIFGFLCRIGGTVVAMVLSLINWYIVDGRTAGVLVFMFVFLAVQYYFFLKYPRFLPATLVCMITHVLIIGYELQVLKIGIAVSESTGQPYYPIYTLAPYRLATVSAGCLISFVWTHLPSPMTDRSRLRHNLSATLYLLADYYSVIRASLHANLHDTGGDPLVKTTPAFRLARHRYRLFGKLMLLLPSLQLHAEWQKWEPAIGGRFPRELYQDIVQRALRITSYLTLMSYTVGWNWTDKSDKEARAWLDALATLLKADPSPAQHSIVLTLTLLSNAMRSGHSLPPHLALPRPYELVRQIEAIAAAKGADDGGPGATNLLHARHMEEPGYAEFAVLQVCSTLVCDDVHGLVKAIEQLVGVVDFSFRLERSAHDEEAYFSSSVGTATDSEEDRTAKKKQH